MKKWRKRILLITLAISIMFSAVVIASNFIPDNPAVAYKYSTLLYSFYEDKQRDATPTESSELLKKAKEDVKDCKIILRRAEYARDPSAYFFSENTKQGRFLNDLIGNILLLGIGNGLLWFIYLFTCPQPYALARRTTNKIERFIKFIWFVDET